MRWSKWGIIHLVPVLPLRSQMMVSRNAESVINLTDVDDWSICLEKNQVLFPWSKIVLKYESKKIAMFFIQPWKPEKSDWQKTQVFTFKVKNKAAFWPLIGILHFQLSVEGPFQRYKRCARANMSIEVDRGAKPEERLDQATLKSLCWWSIKFCFLVWNVAKKI